MVLRKNSTLSILGTLAFVLFFAAVGLAQSKWDQTVAAVGIAAGKNSPGDEDH